MDITHEHRIFEGKYKNVLFSIAESKIVKCKAQNLDWWSYYIFIELDKLPDRVNPETFWLQTKTDGVFTYYPHLEHQLLNEIYFYQPMTYYVKASGFENDQSKAIKIGCDCLHEAEFDYKSSKLYLSDIKIHVKLTIDSLYDHIPEYGNLKIKNIKKN